MIRFFYRALAWLPRLMLATHHFGGLAAWRALVWLRFSRGDAVTQVPMKVLGRPFSFRARSDRGVLCMFYEPIFRVLDAYGKRARVIVDAGANIGDSTVRFRACHPEAMVYAIEADADNFALLEKNFGEDAQVRCLHRALWSSQTTVKVRKTWANVASRVSAGPEEGVEVPAVTVPMLMEEFGLEEIDILKLDIEGAEAEVLRTADQEWLKRVRCLVFEVCDADDPGTASAVIETMLATGLKWQFHLVGECLILVRADTPWHVSADVWMDPRVPVPPYLEEAMAKAGHARLDEGR